VPELEGDPGIGFVRHVIGQQDGVAVAGDDDGLDRLLPGACAIVEAFVRRRAQAMIGSFSLRLPYSTSANQPSLAVVS
jgi:hypothetical protein